MFLEFGVQKNTVISMIIYLNKKHFYYTLVDVLRFIVLYLNLIFIHVPVIQLPAIGHYQCKFLIIPSSRN